LAALVLAGQFVSLAHHFLVQHRLCLEHGELVDVRPGESAEHASTDHAADAQGSTVSGGDGALGADVLDEHCAVLAHRRDQATAPQRAEGVTFIARPQNLAAPRVGALRPPQVVQLSLAPKQSPPA
jgi:hypothetical protein